MIKLYVFLAMTIVLTFSYLELKMIRVPTATTFQSPEKI